ncbi:MAG: type II secretion system F family protein [Firmicutes bacterium]|nr:type II secretion system F family protein [Bacillota bacterium]
MPTFTYRGLGGTGRAIGGARSFASGTAAEEYLKRAGLTGCSVFASRTRYASRAYALVSPKELSVYCREMSVVFFSQVTVMEGLLMIAEHTDNAQLRQALREIHSHMRSGMTFAAAASMYPHILTPYLANMIGIGEAGGTLDTVFEMMSDYFDKEHRTRRRLRSAVSYPLALTVLMAGIVVLMVVKILPMFENTLLSMGGDMPSATKAIFRASDFLARWFWAIAAVVAALALAFARFAGTGPGRLWLDRLKMTFPPGAFIRSRILTARLSRSLAILLKSGVQLLGALEETHALAGNGFAENRLAAVSERVREGEGLSGALRTAGFFPPLFLDMVTIGEATGRLEEMLGRAAGVFDAEAEEAGERLAATLEPALVIVLSVVVGGILLSVMVPMVSVMNAIM